MDYPKQCTHENPRGPGPKALPVEIYKGPTPIVSLLLCQLSFLSFTLAAPASRLISKQEDGHGMCIGLNSAGDISIPVPCAVFNVGLLFQSIIPYASGLAGASVAISIAMPFIFKKNAWYQSLKLHYKEFRGVFIVTVLLAWIAIIANLAVPSALY